MVKNQNQTNQSPPQNTRQPGMEQQVPKLTERAGYKQKVVIRKSGAYSCQKTMGQGLYSSERNGFIVWSSHWAKLFL